MSIKQKTLKKPFECHGIGLHSGAAVRMMVLPAAPNSGIRFQRLDLPGQPVITARHDRVREMLLCTLLEESGVRIGTVEHLMAAFAGLGLDNALVAVDSAELPVMDGSSAPFVEKIDEVGLIEQDAPRRFIEIMKAVTVTDGDKWARLSPAPGFSIDFTIDFSDAAIGRQSLTLDLSPQAFRRHISEARTFGFAHEVEALRAQGLARGGSLDNAVVFQNGQVMNADGLRYGDECVRHKVLDAIGDLYMVGAPIMGAFAAHKSGHALNNRLLCALLADASAWRWTIKTAQTSRPRFIPETAAAALA